jgi:glycoside/pentoside/hexuronide:cation symporter, GPH family
MGLALGVAIAGWVLGWSGFVANVAQNEGTLTAIRWLFSLAPAVFALLNVAALVWYPLTDRTVRQIEQELAARRAGAPA